VHTQGPLSRAGREVLALLRRRRKRNLRGSPHRWSIDSWDPCRRGESCCSVWACYRQLRLVTSATVAAATWPRHASRPVTLLLWIPVGTRFNDRLSLTVSPDTAAHRQADRGCCCGVVSSSTHRPATASRSSPCWRQTESWRVGLLSFARRINEPCLFRKSAKAAKAAN